MSAYTAAQLFVEPERQYKAAVMHNTFGHLAPEPRRKYVGHFIFTYTAWGDITPIDESFEDLPSSPWFFDHLSEFMDKHTNYDDSKKGKVFRFDGTYMMYKNGNCIFQGTVREVNLGLVI